MRHSRSGLLGCFAQSRACRLQFGASGVIYASSVNRRGDHGSFSPSDTLISMMASGPDFKSGMRDPLPTANVDIAPTVARILRFDMPQVQGRVLEEALNGFWSLRPR